MPTYLDEQMKKAADGESEIEGAAAFGAEKMAGMAKTVMEKFGVQLTTEEIERRRKVDEIEAEQSMHTGLAHWYSFFAKNDKYKIVGSVVLDQDKPEPPKLCEAALRKRPMKGGFLEAVLNMNGAAMGKPVDEEGAAPTPDFVKAAMHNMRIDRQDQGVEEEWERDEL